MRQATVYRVKRYKVSGLSGSDHGVEDGQKLAYAGDELSTTEQMMLC